MPANDNSGKMTPELIRDLSRVFSEVDALMKKQEELITIVLKGEKTIADVRIAELDTYFEKYSKKLNDIAKQHKDELSDAFSVLDKKLAEGSKTSSNKRKAVNEEKAVSSTKSQSASGTNVYNASKAISEIRSLLKTGIDVNDKQQQRLLTNILDTLKNQPSGPKSAISNTTNSGTEKTSSTPEEKAALREAYPIVRGINEANTIRYAADNEIAATNELEKGAGQQPVEPIQTPQESSVGTHDSDNKSDIAITEDDVKAEDVSKFLKDLKKQYEKAAKDRILAKNKLIAAGQIEEEIIVQASIDKQLADSYDKQKDYITKIRELQAEAKASQNDEILEVKVKEVKDKAELVQEQKKADLRKKEEDKIFAWRALKEADLQAKKSKLTAEEYAKQLASLDKETEARLKKSNAKAEKELEKENKKDKEKSRLESRSELKKLLTSPLGPGDGLKERFAALKEHTANKITADENGNISKGKKAVAALDTAAAAISDLAKQLENTVDAIGKFKGTIDTRLQGSKNDKRMGSYWDQLIVDMTSVGAVTPFFKQEDFANNIKSLVDRGIAFDLKQRAFLMTIKDKIATTFDVADGTLLRLIRLQQEDSTAGRLGMESALNSFLNEMYENTEYLKDVASSVRGSLLEMEALMDDSKAATEVEYQVQKWMGSLYSVGMSQEAVQNIANTLGQIAAGQIDGLTGGSGAGNLLVMAANASGKSIAEILTEGLNADETNSLLQATVNYLADIAESTKGNNVVQQQIAGVFGVKASDLRAATNLRSDPKDNKNSIGDIYNENLKYSNMLNQLFSMAGSMYARTSVAEMLSNIWANGQYTLAGSMANNPVSYLTYKVASLLDSVAGGIALPFINVMGFGIDLETTVADLMRVASMSGGVLSSLGSMIKGLRNSFSGQAMLRKLGIEEGNGALQINTRGGEGLGAEPTPEGNKVSESGFIGNADSSNIKETTMQAANDDKKKQMIKAKEEEPTNQVDMLNSSVVKIYEILDDVAKGTKTLRVRVDNYGLTGDNKSTKSQGGVNGLSGNATSFSNDTMISSGGANSVSGVDNGLSSSRANNSVTNLGGWTVG